MKTYDPPELTAYIAEKYGYQANFVIPQVNTWLTRGDGLAVYVNHDLSDPGCGDPQIVSYGSPAAQLEVPEPPVTLPDIGTAVNWRYQLEGTYRGGTLAVPDDLPDPPEDDYLFLEDDWEIYDGDEEYDTSDPYDKEYDLP